MKDHKGREINEQWFTDVIGRYKEAHINKFFSKRMKSTGCRQVNGRWVSQISIFGEKKCLGTFDTFAEARAAYEAAVMDWAENFEQYWAEAHND